MKLLVIGVLAAVVSVLLTVTLLVGYHSDQRIVPMFPGTGIAGKLDTLGGPPSAVEIENSQSGKGYAFSVRDDGTFIAPLPPGRYEVRLPGDGRTATLDVPSGECLDLVLDYRFPLVVLEVPREGWPVPRPA